MLTAKLELVFGLHLQVWVALYNHGTIQQEAQVVDMVKAEDGREQANVCLTHIVTQQIPAGTVKCLSYAM